MCKGAEVILIQLVCRLPECRGTFYIERRHSLLRLYYSIGTIEITGKRLDAIFHDAAIGKLGVVTIDAEGTGNFTTAPAITSIVYIPESPLAASERGSRNA